MIWIETMSDLEEVRAAFEGVRDISEEIPIITTMSFENRGRTMMGVSPRQAAEADKVTEIGQIRVDLPAGNP